MVYIIHTFLFIVRQGKRCSLFNRKIANAYSRFTYCIFCEGKHKLKNINEQIEEPLNYLTMISECFKIEVNYDSTKPLFKKVF